MANRKYDLTSGSILKKLLLVAVPIMGTQLMQMAYNLVDIAYLGRVGSEAVAASSTAGFYLWLSNAFLMLGRMGAEIGVSQSLGANDPEGAKRYARGAIWMAVILGTLFGLTMILFRAPLIGFFRLKEAIVVAKAREYLVITSLAMPCAFLSAAVNAPVSVMETAGEGGPYGMALLAAYMLRRKEGESLADYLDKRVFADAKTSSLMADTLDVEGFSAFMERYKKALPVERAAVETM